MSDAETIEDLKKKLEAATKAKDMFLSNVSHELRSPLSTMLMHAQMLKGGDLTPEDQKKTGEAIERATQRQTQTIDDLLDVARAMSGALTFQPQPVSLASIAKGAADNLALAAQKKGVTVTVESKGAVEVTGDFNRLSQVARHLVNNALRFTPKGGAVKVTVVEEHGRGVLRVKDSGAGVDDAWRPFLFNRLTEPDAPARPKPQGGIGFGLSVSHYIIVDQHKGTLALDESGPGGATFALSLPLRASAS